MGVYTAVIQSPSDGHLGCFHAGPGLKTAAMNVLEVKFCQTRRESGGAGNVPHKTEGSVDELWLQQKTQGP